MNVVDNSQEKAVVLVSGGLDSATTLGIARDLGFPCYCLSFDYGQRHRIELESARAVTRNLGAEVHEVIPLDIGWMGGSALTDRSIAVPDKAGSGIPVTYVPARNTIFLSVALGWAEVLGAQHIFIGTNAVDYSGYPDCRPVFLRAFEQLANVATRAGVEGSPFHIHAPLIRLSKAEIIRRGQALGINFALTVSCYDPGPEGEACGVCDSCRLRAQGFRDAGVEDPTKYCNKL
ncbi:MAG: 7-cyano-7-deazaguanine synthase QueC [Acidiferrobacterales bacterium]